MRRTLPAKPFQPGHPVYPPKTPEAEIAKRTKKVWSLQETRVQEQAIESLLLQGATESQVLRVMRNHPQAPCARVRVTKIMTRIRERWAHEDQNMRAQWKSAAIRRLTQHIENAKGAIADNGTYYDANFPAIASFERELAAIQGTHEPLEVKMDLQVSQAVAHAIVAMTPEQVQHALADMLEMERKATLWDATAEKKLPAKTG